MGSTQSTRMARLVADGDEAQFTITLRPNQNAGLTALLGLWLVLALLVSGAGMWILHLGGFGVLTVGIFAAGAVVILLAGSFMFAWNQRGHAKVCLLERSVLIEKTIGSFAYYRKRIDMSGEAYFRVQRPSLYRQLGIDHQFLGLGSWSLCLCTGSSRIEALSHLNRQEARRLVDILRARGSLQVEEDPGLVGLS